MASIESIINSNRILKEYKSLLVNNPVVVRKLNSNDQILIQNDESTFQANSRKTASTTKSQKSSKKMHPYN